MRRLLVVSALVLLGCKKPKVDITPAPSATTSVAMIVDAGPPAPEPEKGLTWGARPNEKGPLFPVVDGTCQHGEVWPVGDRTYFTSANSAVSSYYANLMARLDDDGLVIDPNLTRAAGAADKEKADLLRNVHPTAVFAGGSSIVLFDTYSHRMFSSQSIWQLGETGWTELTPPGEKDQPMYTAPAAFHGWLVAGRANTPQGEGTHEYWWENPSLKSWPLEKDAPPIPNLNQFVRAKFFPLHVFAAKDSLYVFGSEPFGPNTGEAPNVVRVLKDGKVSEGVRSQENGVPHVVGTIDDSLIETTSNEVRRIDGVKTTKVPFKPGGAKITGAGVAPNGDIWVVTSKNVVHVLHDGADTETPLPVPANPLPQEISDYVPLSGSTLAGVEFDDPWAIGKNGALFHLVGGAWSEVEMPPSPFAVAKYQAQALVMKTKGDILVNAGYLEKGPGWKNADRYRAILRTKRPKEVMRCNASQPLAYTASDGYSSSAPLATDACTTPFAVLLRLGAKSAPNYAYGRQSGYPGFKNILKTTPSLGGALDLVEFTWGAEEYLGARVPSLAAGKELAVATAKTMKYEFLETHPEVVCGYPPKIDKTIQVGDAGAAPAGSAP